MLVYKHEMHFWGLFWHVHVKNKFLFQSNTFKAKYDVKVPKIERLEQRPAYPISRSQTHKYYKNRHFKEKP